MNTRMLVMVVCCCIGGIGVFSHTACLAQEEGVTDMAVVGVVQEIAADKNSIVVNDTTILTESDFFDYCDMAVGDEVTIYVFETDEGLVALDCSYMQKDRPIPDEEDMDYRDDMSESSVTNTAGDNEAQE